jgi:hypothetical protein
MTVLRNYEQLASASSALVQTDIPTRDLPGLVTVAQKVPGQEIDAISLVPPLVDPARPDFTTIHALVEEATAGIPNGEEATASEEESMSSVGNADSAESAAYQGGAVPQKGTSPPDAPSADDPGLGDPATAEDLGLVCQAM